MKKSIWIILALALLLPCLAAGEAAQAPSETVEIRGKFSLTCTVPEGYRYEENQVDEDLIVGSLEAEDGLRPSILFAVAASKEYAGRTLNDFTENELEELSLVAIEDMKEPTVTYGETAHGTKLIISRDMDPVNSTLDITTVYKGYYISFLMYPAIDGTVLTDEQVQTCIDFISDLWMVEK